MGGRRSNSEDCRLFPGANRVEPGQTGSSRLTQLSVSTRNSVYKLGTRFAHDEYASSHSVVKSGSL